MFDYLQKFNTLPQNLRDSVSSPAAMLVISELEAKYKIDLAATVMKVMAKIIPLAELSIYFVSDFSLDQDSAKKLTADLKERLFFPVANYLGYNASYSSIVPKTAVAPVHVPVVDKIIKDSGVTFAGLELNARFKNVLTTYIKGVRSRVDARMTLNKEIISGGLGLDHKIIDKIFKICDEVRAGQILPSGTLNALPSGAELSLPNGEDSAKSGLDKVRALYEKPGAARDIPYDLKTAIDKGEIKKPVVPLNLPIPVEAGEKLLVEHKEEVKPIIVPAPLVKPTEPIKIVEAIKAPEIKPTEKINPLTKIGPMVDAISAAATVIAPAKMAVIIPAVAAIKAIDALKPEHTSADAPKINRPPERKPGMFSRLFGSKKETPIPAPAPIIKNVVTPPAPQPSIATLRNEAAAIQNKPVVKAQQITPDIKIVPKVMGPLEELRYLDIINFRRFGANPQEATAKVESKIKLLEKDGYDKLISGVSAWRESPVNYTYLKMGQDALAKGVSFKQYAIESKNQSPANYLSWEEIEAIMVLNGRLMF